MYKVSLLILWTMMLCLCIACINKGKNSNSLSQNAKQSTDHPNIIYILADDLGYGDLSCYGQTNYSTPNIDALAKEGMLFTQHYSGSTVCAPSRSALMTGMHTGHTVVRGNKEVLPEGQHPIPASTFTIAEALQGQGYKTGAFGKWGLGFPRSEGDPTKQGFDTFFGYNCQRLGHNYYPRHLWSNTDSVILEGNKGNGKKIYAPHLIHDKTLEFIKVNKDEPFFLFVASIIPHAELEAPEEDLSQFRGRYLPEHVYEGVDDGPEYREGPYGSQKESHAAFAAMITILDRQVGEIVAKLNELGLGENTLIVFTSDNGPHREGGADPIYFDSNGPLRGFKRDLYEGGIRVPMIAKWPGKIKKNTKTDHVSAFWDIFPTFADIAATSKPQDIDGISFLPTLLNKANDQNQHDYLYWEFHEKGGRQAVRKGKWKAVKYNVLKDPEAKLELYDLTVDVGEEHNIAIDHPDVVKDLEIVIKNARTESSVFNFSHDTYLNSK